MVKEVQGEPAVLDPFSALKEWRCGKKSEASSVPGSVPGVLGPGAQT